MREKLVFTTISYLMWLGSKVNPFESREGSIKYYFLLSIQIFIISTILLTGLVAVGIGVDPLD